MNALVAAFLASDGPRTADVVRLRCDRIVLALSEMFARWDERAADTGRRNASRRCTAARLRSRATCRAGRAPTNTIAGKLRTRWRSAPSRDPQPRPVPFRIESRAGDPDSAPPVRRTPAPSQRPGGVCASGSSRSRRATRQIRIRVLIRSAASGGFGELDPAQQFHADVLSGSDARDEIALPGAEVIHPAFHCVADIGRLRERETPPRQRSFPSLRMGVSHHDVSLSARYNKRQVI